MKILNALAVAAFAITGTVAQAATITTTFDFTGTSFYNQTSRGFTSEDGSLSLNVTAGLYKTPSVGGELDVYAGTDFSNSGSSGLYIDSTGDSDETHCGYYSCYHKDADHRIDGWYNEVALFDFGDREVTMTNIALNYLRSGSILDFFSGDPLSLTSQGAASANTTVDGTGFTFGIGASDDHSGFKITGLTVSYEVPDVSEVPLPAGAPLLLGALAMLGVARRRRSAAA